mmetsp:Transcript_11452/g.10113  ORF Transcript_11452/g.10113 Transcript_11452/m.10113 type:complete len:141 (-) Transcript_11452:490-912(-)
MPELIVDCYTVFPSLDTANEIEIYNTVLGLYRINNQSDIFRPIDNEAMYNACFKSRVTSPTFSSFNTSIATSIACTAANMLFPSMNSINLRDFASIAKPYPSLMTLFQTCPVALDRSVKFFKNIHSPQNYMSSIKLSGFK